MINHAFFNKSSKYLTDSPSYVEKDTLEYTFP